MMGRSLKTEATADGLRMPLREHFREFRNRIIKVCIGLVVGMVFGWYVFPAVFEFLQAPVTALAEQGDFKIEVNFAGAATALDMRLKLSLATAIVVTSPWWLYQLWAFVSPGLKRKEKLYAVGFLGAAVPFFLGGVALALIVYPRAVHILVGFTPADAANFLDVQMLLSFAMRVTLALGLAFMFPVLMVALSMARLVQPRTWWRSWRWSVVIIFTFAAIVTPTPDVITMLAMAGPMCTLYFGAAGVTSLLERRRRKREL